MGIYLYKALDSSGKITEGQVDALDQNGVIAKLKELKLSPLNVAEGKAKGRKAGKRKKITRRDILNLTNQLASLLGAKLPLVKALGALEKQATNLEIKKLIADISAMVGEGKTLSEALSEYPKYFPELFRSMVKAGEVGGILDEALAKVFEMLERDEALRSKIKGALTYPAIMLVVMMASIVVLITFVVPRFTGVFADMGGALPLPTKILVSVSDFFQSWWWIMGLAAAGGYSAFRAYVKTDEGRLAFDRLKLDLPMIGQLLREMALSRFSLTFGSLLGSGVPVLQAIEATRDVAGNRHVGMVLDGIKKEVKEGRTLSEALSEHEAIFPSLVTGMVGTGEETGNLGEMLTNIGNYFMQEADAKIKTLTTMLEPMIILVMGLMVGFIIIAMLLPIFEMTMMVK